MAALTTLAVAAGIGSLAFGAYNSFEGQGKQKEGYQLMQQGAAIQAEAARQQAAISKEQAAASVTFAGQERDINTLAASQSVTAAGQSRDIRNSTIAQEQNIQEQNRQAMELGARRQNLEIIRNQQRARAMALTTGVSQGGSGAVRGSSALGGAYGQIAGQSGVNLMGVQQNLQLGRNIFEANTNISNNRIQMSDLEYQYALQQAANQTSKSNLAYDYAVSNAGFQTRFADTQTLMAQGQGLTSQGQGIVGQGQSQSQFGSSFLSAGTSLFNAGFSANSLFPNFNLGGGSSSFNPFNVTGSLY